MVMTVQMKKMSSFTPLWYFCELLHYSVSLSTTITSCTVLHDANVRKYYYIVRCSTTKPAEEEDAGTEYSEVEENSSLRRESDPNIWAEDPRANVRCIRKCCKV